MNFELPVHEQRRIPSRASRTAWAELVLAAAIFATGARGEAESMPLEDRVTSSETLFDHPRLTYTLRTNFMYVDAACFVNGVLVSHSEGHESGGTPKGITEPIGLFLLPEGNELRLEARPYSGDDGLFAHGDRFTEGARVVVDVGAMRSDDEWERDRAPLVSLGFDFGSAVVARDALPSGRYALSDGALVPAEDGRVALGDVDIAIAGDTRVEIRRSFRVPHRFPRWRWADGETITEDDAPRVRAALETVHAALRAGDLDAYLGLAAEKIEDEMLVWGLDSIEDYYEDGPILFEYAEGERVDPLADDLRFVIEADGRLARFVRDNGVGSGSIQMRRDEENSASDFQLWFYRRADGTFALIR